MQSAEVRRVGYFRTHRVVAQGPFKLIELKQPAAAATAFIEGTRTPTLTYRSLLKLCHEISAWFDIPGNLILLTEAI